MYKLMIAIEPSMEKKDVKFFGRLGFSIFAFHNIIWLYYLVFIYCLNLKTNNNYMKLVEYFTKLRWLFIPFLGSILQCSPKWWPLEQLPVTQEVKCSRLGNSGSFILLTIINWYWFFYFADEETIPLTSPAHNLLKRNKYR
jgi:hypothetical protein